MKPDQTELYIDILKLVLPPDLFDYFDIIKVSSSDKSVDVFLDEKYLKPIKYTQQKLISKGFHQAVTIQDFPIRERTVYLHVRCRRWTIEDTGQIVSSELNSIEKGTRYTKGFASFLKELFGQLPN